MSTCWPVRTGDLLLRDARPEDLDGLLTWRNDPEVNRWMMRTSVDPDDFRRDWLAAPGSAVDHSCVVELDGEVVAMGWLEIVDDGLHPETPTGVEGLIGYMVRPDLWGRGIAGAVAKELVRAAFGVLGLRRVKAYCHRDNPASARILEGARMRREEHTVQDSWHAERGWVDGYGYAVLAEEWCGEASGLPEVRDASASVPPRRPLPPVPTTRGGVCRTERLELGPGREEDLPHLLAWRNHPEVGAWMLNERKDEAALRAAFVELDEGARSFVARLDGVPVGTCTVTLRDAAGQPGGPVHRREAEVGYSLDPRWHGQGLGREIAAAGLDVSFAEPGVRRVTAGLYLGNTASVHLLEGLGLRREQHGVRDSWHPRYGWVDGGTYAILDREWRGAPGGPARSTPSP